MVTIAESPRDAMQGIDKYIVAKKKAAYINSLLKVGYDIIDFGSFVSPKAIPQLRDTAAVIEQLDLSETRSELLAIVANKKGGEIAASFDHVTYLGYPHSISEQFLKLNINSNYKKSGATIATLSEICYTHDKKLMVYISMGFGNPYGEDWSVNKLEDCTGRLSEMGVDMINISDTIGMATPENTRKAFSQLINNFPGLNFGFHLHTTLTDWYDIIDNAFKAGCRHFDGVINGLGGCPMAGTDLIGNLPTSKLLEYFGTNNIQHSINLEAFKKAKEKAMYLFL